MHAEGANGGFAESNGGDGGDYDSSGLFGDAVGLDAERDVARVPSVARGNWTAFRRRCRTLQSLTISHLIPTPNWRAGNKKGPGGRAPFFSPTPEARVLGYFVRVP
jgi:hypothetical protein